MVVQNSLTTPRGEGGIWVDLYHVGVGVSVRKDFGKLIRSTNQGLIRVDIPVSADDAMTPFFLPPILLLLFSIRV